MEQRSKFSTYRSEIRFATPIHICEAYQSFTSSTAPTHNESNFLFLKGIQDAHAVVTAASKDAKADLRLTRLIYGDSVDKSITFTDVFSNYTTAHTEWSSCLEALSTGSRATPSDSCSAGQLGCCFWSDLPNEMMRKMLVLREQYDGSTLTACSSLIHMLVVLGSKEEDTLQHDVSKALASPFRSIGKSGDALKQLILTGELQLSSVLATVADLAGIGKGEINILSVSHLREMQAPAVHADFAARLDFRPLLVTFFVGGDFGSMGKSHVYDGGRFNLTFCLSGK